MGAEPLEMLYRENLATPIGTSGGLQYTQPALAETLACTCVAEAKETAVEIILTDDPLDTAQLEKYADGIRGPEFVSSVGRAVTVTRTAEVVSTPR